MLDFNKRSGQPVHLFGSKEPSFYLDTTDINMTKAMRELGERLKNFNPSKKLSEEEQFKVIDEEIDFMIQKIDEMFGEGVSNIVMDNKKSVAQLACFIEFILEAIKKDRDKLTSKYKKTVKAGKKGVM